jgi:hypothetical protein
MCSDLHPFPLSSKPFGVRPASRMYHFDGNDTNHRPLQPLAKALLKITTAKSDIQQKKIVPNHRERDCDNLGSSAQVSIPESAP